MLCSAVSLGGYLLPDGRFTASIQEVICMRIGCRLICRTIMMMVDEFTRSESLGLVYIEVGDFVSSSKW